MRYAVIIIVLFTLFIIPAFAGANDSTDDTTISSASNDENELENIPCKYETGLNLAQREFSLNFLDKVDRRLKNASPAKARRKVLKWLGIDIENDEKSVIGTKLMNGVYLLPRFIDENYGNADAYLDKTERNRRGDLLDGENTGFQQFYLLVKEYIQYLPI